VELSSLAFMALLLCALTLAFSKGGRPERVTGALLLAFAIVSPVLQRGSFNDIQYLIAQADFALLLALLVIARRWQRPWLTVAVAFQILTATLPE
jgi:hypothetical protein